MKDPIFEIINGDKRKVKRITLSNPVQTTLNLLGQDIPVQLNNYSYTGLGLFVPREHLKNGQISTVESKIVFPKHEFNGQVMYSEKLSAEMMHVGFQLPPDPKHQYLFKKEDPSWDVVKEPSTVKNIYDDLVFKSYECPVQIYQNQNLLSFFPLKQTSSGTIIGEIYEHKQGRVSKGACYCNFSLFQTYHMFQSEVLKLEGDKIEVKMSPTVNRLLRRETLRVEKEEREHELTVRLTSNLLQQEFIHQDVFDYSEHGLSLVDTEEKFSFPKGMPIEQIQIQIDGAGSIEGKGYVRNYIWSREKQAYLLGIRFDTEHEPSITNWHNFILKARYPSLDFKYTEKDHSKIWNLFDQSGYIKENSGLSGDMQQKTVITWSSLEESGAKYSKRIMIKIDEEIVGHLQIDKIFPKTWCMHHLAINPKTSKTVGNEIFSSLVDILSYEDVSYLINFTDSDKSWNDRSYYKFVENYPFKDHNEMKNFKVYSIQESSIPQYKNEFISSEANRYDEKTLLRFFEYYMSELERQACSLDRENLFLESFNQELQEYNLYRKRLFLVIKEPIEKKMVGIARIELGTEGVNVFNSQNMIYLYVLDDSIRVKVMEGLLKSVKNFMKEENINEILICVDEKAQAYFEESLKLKIFSDAMRWIALKEIYSRYQAYSKNMYGHLILKREKIRKKIKKENVE